MLSYLKTVTKLKSDGFGPISRGSIFLKLARDALPKSFSSIPHGPGKNRRVVGSDRLKVLLLLSPNYLLRAAHVLGLNPAD
jgi:hypothetical protein